MPKLKERIVERNLQQASLFEYPAYKPSEVLPSDMIGHRVAFDIESSNEHPDDGGRVSIVSVAWIPTAIERDEELLTKAIATGIGVVSYAFPFDQGVRADEWRKKDLNAWAIKRYKPEQYDLFQQPTEYADPNLNSYEWFYLLRWLIKQRLTSHNFKFDHMFALAGTRFNPGISLMPAFYWDTFLGCKELYPLQPAGLKDTLARLYGDNELAAKKALAAWLGPEKDRRYDLVPWHIAGVYAAKDAEQHIRLLWHQLLYMQEENIDNKYLMHRFAVMRVLAAIELRGIPYDSVASLDAAHQLDIVIKELAAQLPFECNDNAAKRYWFGTKEKGGLYLQPYGLTPITHEPQLSIDILRQMSEGGIVGAETYARARALRLARQDWYLSYAERVGSDGRIRPVIKQTLDASGRYSAERFNGYAIPQDDKLEMLPPDIPTPRKLVKAKPGFVMYEADLSQAELRIAAVKVKCHKMLSLFRNNIDVHSMTTHELFHIDEDSPQWKRMRKVGKQGNFQIIFDISAAGFRESVRKQIGIQISLLESETIIDRWHATYPEFNRVSKRMRWHVKDDGYVTLIDGSLSWFRSFDDPHKAFARWVQSSLAILAQHWMLDTEARWPGILILTVHDSQVVEIPIGGINGHSPQEIMEDIVRRANEIGTKMFGVSMPATYGLWNVH